MLEKMKKTYGDKMTLTYVDLADKNSSREADKKYKISAYPLVVLFNDKDEEVDTFSGFKDKREITKILKENGLIK